MQDPLDDIDYQIAWRCVMDWLPWALVAILVFVVVGFGICFLLEMIKSTFKG